jgi:hypothetical protein
MSSDPIQNKIERLEKQVERLLAQLPERGFQIYLEGLADGRQYGKLTVTKAKIFYNHALGRIEQSKKERARRARK